MISRLKMDASWYTYTNRNRHLRPVVHKISIGDLCTSVMRIHVKKTGSFTYDSATNLATPPWNKCSLHMKKITSPRRKQFIK
jgi:hypothetical protein